MKLLLVNVLINWIDSALDYINGDRNVKGEIWLGEMFFHSSYSTFIYTHYLLAAKYLFLYFKDAY